MREALLGLLRSDVLHVWPAEQVVDYYLLPLVDEAVEQESRRRAREFVAEISNDVRDGLREQDPLWHTRPSHAELEHRRYPDGDRSKGTKP